MTEKAVEDKELTDMARTGTARQKMFQVRIQLQKARNPLVARRLLKELRALQASIKNPLIEV